VVSLTGNQATGVKIYPVSEAINIARFAEHDGASRRWRPGGL